MPAGQGYKLCEIQFAIPFPDEKHVLGSFSRAEVLMDYQSMYRDEILHFSLRQHQLKNEIIHHRDYHTRDQARSEIFEYIELFYNRKRIHQSLNYQTPMQYESVKLSTN